MNPETISLENISWFVAPHGNDTNNCKTANTPCLTINGVINKADSGGVILVATGTYSNSNLFDVVVISKSITLDGGWDATFTTHNGQTIIDGQSIRGGIKVTSNTTVNISNMMIQNGLRSHGAGIYNEGDLTLRNMAIANNRAENEGGGIYHHSGKIDLENVTISNNIAQSNEGFLSTVGVKWYVLTIAPSTKIL
jgi:hypothetical protein